MAIRNPISITYGSLTVGGASSTYLLHGPYVIDKSHTGLRLVFDVVVTASTVVAMQAASDLLEDEFTKRDQDLTINLDGASWAYESGEEILNTRATVSKTTDPDVNRGTSRGYTVVVEGELPATDKEGLRDLEVHVDWTPSRQKIVSMRGTYTAHDGDKASAVYAENFDAEASTILTAVGDGEGAFELVDEQYTRDRLDHIASFQRQYVQVLDNQAGGQLDDDRIRDHRFVFTDLSHHPGDSRSGVNRLRRVVGSYDCAIDIEEDEDPDEVWKDDIRDHVVQRFRETFDPKVWAVEEERVSFDRTGSRLSASMQFVYQRQQGQDVIEVSESVAYREQRTVDLTPLHNQGELAAIVDTGWAVRERVWSRTVIVIGNETPKSRVGDNADSGPAGLFTGQIGGISGIDGRDDGKVHTSGWTVVANTSQVTPQWIGDPSGEQIRVSILTETVVERYNDAADTTSSPTTG